MSYIFNAWRHTLAGFKKIDETMFGRVFDKLTVTGIAPKKIRTRKTYKCKCECGNTTYADKYSLTSGDKKSCGCNRFTLVHKGLNIRYKKEYSSWSGMINRCYNPSNIGYNYYHGKGITVCNRWRFGEKGKTGFECFFEDMGAKPINNYTLDRVATLKSYSKENCRWADSFIQNTNKVYNMSILSIDPGADNYSVCWIKDYKVMASYMLKYPIKNLTAETYNNSLSNFINELEDLVHIAKPQAITAERFMARRIQSNLSEMIGIMNGILVDMCKEKEIQCYLIIASQWKIALSKHVNMDELYSIAKKQYKLLPHQVDSMCIGKYLANNKLFFIKDVKWIKNNLKNCLVNFEQVEFHKKFTFAFKGKTDSSKTVTAK